jgi:hypothetical protein
MISFRNIVWRMEGLLFEHRRTIAWLLLWLWIALTLFIMAYRGSKSGKFYFVYLLLLAGSLLLFIWD